MSKRICLISAVGALALASAGLAPAASNAAVSCSYSAATHQLTISANAANDVAGAARGGTAILVNNGACAGAPTVNNTDSIVWINNSGGKPVTAIANLNGGPLAPGFSPEVQGAPEIEMTVNGGSGVDTFEVFGSPQPDSVEAGKDASGHHVNLNVADDPALEQDADVTLNSVEKLVMEAGGGADTLTAGGGAATGGPSDLPLTINGGFGPDKIMAGSALSRLVGGPDGDTIDATNVSNARLLPGTGNDTVLGGANADTIEYSDAPAGVTVDLAKTGPQDTGGAGVDTISGVEYLRGSNFDDRLSGTEDYEEILGLGGADLLEGRGGNDSLIGGDDVSAKTGPDTVSYASPSPGVSTGVKVDLNVQGAPQDTGSEGKDFLAGIGNVIASPYDDAITGDAQANRLDAGSGADTVSAGDGPDALFLRDGIGDTADCGGADDSVESDAAGLDVLTGCEQVAFAPTPPAAATNQAAGGTTTGAGDTTLTFRFAAASRQRLGRRGTVRMTLLCPAEACRGRVSGAVTVRPRSRGAAVRRLRGGTASVALTAGKRRALSLVLSARTVRKVRAALRRGDRVTVKVTATARDAAGNSRVVRRTITLRR